QCGFDGQRRYDSNRIAFSRIRNVALDGLDHLLKLVLQDGKLLVAAVIQVVIEPGVPFAHGYIKRDSSDDGQADRQYDSGINAEVVRSVDICGFDEAVGQLLEERSHDENVEGADDSRNDIDGKSVHQPKILDQQV